uniref:Uncharacterized protein n=1 Tax=Romanomermis culicivorax TaxID=13658 RepID=A0A915J7U8_ROMCU
MLKQKYRISGAVMQKIFSAPCRVNEHNTSYSGPNARKFLTATWTYKMKSLIYQYFDSAQDKETAT